MTSLKRFVSVLGLLALAACGGGGGSNAGSPPFGDGNPTPPTSSVADLAIVLESATLANNSTAPVAVTVTALDANRNAISGVPVTLGANSNAVVTVTSGALTNATGQLLATVGFGSDTTAPRTITLTATSGNATKTASLQVVSGASVQPATIDLIASANSVGTGGDTVAIQAFVKDANNSALANAPVVFSVDTGTLTNVSSSTNIAGVASATYSAGSNKANRTAAISVSAQAINARLTLPIVDTKLLLSGPTSVIIGQQIEFTVIATDSRNNPVAGATVTGTSSLGNAISRPSGDVTDSSGRIRFTYTAAASGTDAGLVFQGLGSRVSPTPALVISGDDFTFASPTASTNVPVNTVQSVQVRLRVGGVPQASRTVNFAATGGTLSSASATTDSAGLASISIQSGSAGPVTLQASVAGVATSATLPLNFVATVPSKVVLQISPNALPITTVGSSSNNPAQVIARVSDANGNPVAGQSVNFSRVIDPSGGNLLQASATTDGSGVAIVSYRSGPESTASNGVVLRATVAGSSPAIAADATLTVNQSALFITLGTGNVISNLDPQTYKKDWVAYVTDANGVAVNNVNLTAKSLPLSYLTGVLGWNGVSWTYVSPIFECKNEDLNLNGILDAGEDANRDLALTPGNVIAVTPSSIQTANGRATVSNVYAESFAPWVGIRLTASAVVSGTESKRDADFIVDGAAEDFGNESNPPAGGVSPFGALPRPSSLTAQQTLQQIPVGGAWPGNSSCARVR